MAVKNITTGFQAKKHPRIISRVLNSDEDLSLKRFQYTFTPHVPKQQPHISLNATRIVCCTYVVKQLYSHRGHMRLRLWAISTQLLSRCPAGRWCSWSCCCSSPRSICMDSGCTQWPRERSEIVALWQCHISMRSKQRMYSLNSKRLESVSQLWTHPNIRHSQTKRN